MSDHMVAQYKRPNKVRPYGCPFAIPFNPANDHELVASLLQSLFTTEKTGPALKAHVESIVHPDSWTSHLAQHLLDGLVHALNSNAQMGGAMKEAFDRASAATELFVREHPILVGVIATVVALGILALLVPWAIEPLGFAELGPIEGSWAALWQSTFPDVTADSWFAFFQRLGMTLGKK
ncbi:hypothetical protein MBM_03671 [Drepanopeziza brunnea f. sp. 'multigermtubi' MB_m1]|uniref:Lincomycin-condensing protein lmbA n=1 Tax=Marssonina brunnea f. sp. multigermtubi (strain MB_m1) TaxID=1072389 RepID=K1XYI4_MARBU|nr:uncharacterized protein MBM_03671 [Drepanopeziza brunnea f. sp. 'multigermtubi' MB_m1]EKD17899.1 hypothetical protein MBM_03671 [Drepanopeziza brunnea f. sp. 'multigermtubi' MB_m1]